MREGGRRGAGGRRTEGAGVVGSGSGGAGLSLPQVQAHATAAGRERGGCVQQAAQQQPLTGRPRRGGRGVQQRKENREPLTGRRLCQTRATPQCRWGPSAGSLQAKRVSTGRQGPAAAPAPCASAPTHAASAAAPPCGPHRRPHLQDILAPIANDAKVLEKDLDLGGGRRSRRQLSWRAARRGHTRQQPHRAHSTARRLRGGGHWSRRR